MNPLTHFEESARKIWQSNFGPEQKAMQLTDLGNRINSYLSRLNAVQNGQDAWVQAAMDRARKHLTNLAADMHHLAILCKQPS